MRIQWRERLIRESRVRFFALFLISITPQSLAESKGADLSSLSFEEMLQIKVISVSKVEESLREVPMSTYVFTREEMDKFGIRYFSEVLARSPGFGFYDIEYTGLNGPIGRGQQSIWRFGFSLELAPVPDWADIYLPMDFFKQVEVTRGPAGLTWGGAAEAGLFNLVIRDDLHGSEGRVEYGNRGRRQYTYMYGNSFSSGKNQDNNFFIGLSTGEQDFEVQNDAWSQSGETWFSNGWKPSYAFLGKIDYKPFKVLYFKTYGDKVTPTFRAFEDEGLRDALFAAQGEEMHDTMEIEVYRGEYHFDPKWLREGRTLTNYDAYVYVNHYVKSWWVEGFAIDTTRKDSAGFSLSGSVFMDRVNLSLGGDLWSKEQLTAPSMTHPDWSEKLGINWFGGANKTDKFETQNLYLQTKIKLGTTVRLILGGRKDWSDDYEDSGQFTPRLGLIYLPNDRLTFKLLWNQSKRFPTANELVDADDIPDAEELEAIELVAMLSYPGKLHANVSLFSQILENQIVFDTGPNIYNNADGSEFVGLEWDIKTDFDSRIQFYANGIYLDKQEVDTSKNLESALVLTVEPFNSKGEFLFVPGFSNTLGTEIIAYSSEDYDIKLNVTYRTQLDIPYFTDVDHNEDYKDANFLDAGLHMIFKQQDVKVSLYGRNITESGSGLPAYGEHTQIFDYGLLDPEGRRIWLKFSAHW